MYPSNASSLDSPPPSYDKGWKDDLPSPSSPSHRTLTSIDLNKDDTNSTLHVTPGPSSFLSEKKDALSGPDELPEYILKDPNYREPGALYPADHYLGWFSGVLPTFLATFVVSGYNYSFGLYQSYYLQGPYAGQASTTALTLIGCLGAGTIYLLGPVMGLLVERYGVRFPLLASSIIVFLGLFLASLASQPWHLYLTQGLMYGIGGSLAFYSTISLSSQWFRRHRGLAGGVAYSGSGIGGIAYSEVAKAFLARSPENGHVWALRVVSFMSLGILLVATYVARERFPKGHGRVPGSKSGFAAVFDFSLLRNPTFSLLAVMGCLCTFGFLGPFYLTPSYASFIGLASTDGATLSTILSAISGLGRIFLGFVADRLGKINSLFLCTFIAGLVCMVYWPFAHSFPSLIGYVVLYGLFGGGFTGLLPPVVAIFVRPERLAKAMGVLFCLQALGLYSGSLIAAAILDSTAPNTNYLPAMMYCGAVTVAASALILWLRIRVNPSLFTII
ncbi:MAG: major facilitator superfamily domain-containing protein [Piptocephalis tieghemiana]|nr:MAG: major facilitator superfamily domain-containing protein [Piptocephalis tieghemiana]